MRIYRDIRFSKDKSPYKTHIGINWWEGRGKGGSGYHFFMDAEGAAFYAGHHEFDQPFMAAFRKAVDGERTGRALQQALAKLGKSGGYQIGGEQFKRVPPGFPADHPRGDLLRYKGLWVRSPTMKPAELASPKLIAACLKHARAMLPVQQWFAELSAG
jgi:uncharacterized protein (TIGR02453 family)